MQISKEDYFFYEWLIIDQGMNQETFSKLSSAKIAELRAKWKAWFDKQ